MSWLRPGWDRDAPRLSGIKEKNLKELQKGGVSPRGFPECGSYRAGALGQKECAASDGLLLMGEPKPGLCGLGA